MKSWRIVAFYVLFTGLAVGGILLFKAKLEGPPPWSTTSTMSQGGLTFLGVYKGRPRFMQQLRPASDSPNYWGNRWAYFRYPKDAEMSVNDALFRGKNVPDIRIWGFDQSNPSNPNDEYRYFVAPVPEQYAPEYQNGLLVLKSKGKEIGSWQISGMPAPEREIKENEPYVLTGEAVGCKFKLESPVEQVNLRIPETKELTGHVWSPMLQVSRPLAAPGDQYQILVATERTTWIKCKPTGSSTIQLPEKGRVRANLGSICEMPNDRIGFGIKVQKYRTLDDLIVLKNLVVGKSSEARGEYVLKSCDSPEIRSKNGFVGNILFSKVNGLYEPRGYTVNIESSTDCSGGILEDSPLYKQFRKPISISCQNAVGTMWSNKNLYLAFKLPPNKGEQTIKIPELKLAFRQTVVLEEKALHFLAPTKEVEQVNIWSKAKHNDHR